MQKLELSPFASEAFFGSVFAALACALLIDAFTRPYFLAATVLTVGILVHSA
jgi:hypothetical protein